MFGGLGKFFSYLWNSITEFFKDIGKLFSGKKDDNVAPPAVDGGSNTSETSAETTSQEQAAAKETSAAKLAPIPIEFDASSRDRIKINAYGEQDLDKWKDYRLAHGMDIQDAMQAAEHEKQRGIAEAYFKQDSRISRESRAAWAKGALEEYDGKMAKLEQQYATAMRPIDDITEFVKLDKGAKLAQQATHGYAPDITIDKNHIMVALPKNVDAEINVARMKKDSPLLSVDIIPKGGTAMHMDNVTLAELNTMIVGHPGENNRVAINSKSDIPDVNIAMVNMNQGQMELIDPSDRKLVHIGDNVGVNGLYKLPQGGTTAVAASFVPSPTPTIAKVDNGKQQGPNA